MADKDNAKVVGGILQEPAEGDRDMIDRELAREDGGNVENDNGGGKTDGGKTDGTGSSNGAGKVDLHDRVRTGIDEAAPQTGVRPGP
jgi:hypothetical protein